MPGQPRRRHSGFVPVGGGQPAGPHDDITDVPGVTVGHATIALADGVTPRTGVTVVVPHGGAMFDRPMRAAVHVINGFGKLTGISQIVELGLLETPIALTNTMAVGAAYEGLVRLAVEQSPTAYSVNAVVGECNDAAINDIRELPVRPEHVLAAYAARGVAPELGSIGAGSGMVSFGWKAGLGSSSRLVTSGADQYLVGALVMANLGRSAELTVAGVGVGLELDRRYGPQIRRSPMAGSCVVILATDAPLSDRQLGRLARRAQNGIARTGANTEHDSGEYVIAFSTADRDTARSVADNSATLGAMFDAVAAVVEQSLLESLLLGQDTPARDGGVIRGLPVDVVQDLMGRPGTN